MRPGCSLAYRLLNALLAILLAAFLSCSGGYEYIPPVDAGYVPPDLENFEVVSYRQLARRDFRAEEPSLQYRSQKKKVAAQITMYLSATPIIDAIEVPSNADSVRWEPVIDNLVFEAVMIPDASWWNPKKNKEKDVTHILEHEQVHFTLTEIEARRANARSEETLRRIRTNGSSQADATFKTLRKFRHVLDRLQDGLTAIHAKFDMETKNGLDKEKQKQWVERVERLLEETDPLAPGD